MAPSSQEPELLMNTLTCLQVKHSSSNEPEYKHWSRQPGRQLLSAHSHIGTALSVCVITVLHSWAKSESAVPPPPLSAGFAFIRVPTRRHIPRWQRVLLIHLKHSETRGPWGPLPVPGHGSCLQGDVHGPGKACWCMGGCFRLREPASFLGS